jgi:hypothetical protein
MVGKFVPGFSYVVCGRQERDKGTLGCLLPPPRTCANIFILKEEMFLLQSSKYCPEITQKEMYLLQRKKMFDICIMSQIRRGPRIKILAQPDHAALCQ